MGASHRQGHVVIAPVTPDAGEKKARPAIVLSTREQIEKTGRVLVIGCTTSYFPDNDDYNELPWRGDGKVTTGFRGPSAAKITMVEEFAAGDVKATGRYVNRERMAALLAWIARKGSA